MRIAITVFVEDVAGYQHGLPAILSLFKQYDIHATFLLSPGFDNSGLRIRRLFRPWLLSSQLPTIQKLYGTLLPPKSLNKYFKPAVLSCIEQGHDVGLASFDSVLWQNQGLDASEALTRQHMNWSVDAFVEATGQRPKIHAASGCIVNKHLYKLERELGFELGIESRGKTLYLPRYQGVESDVLQLPITLPYLEELLVQDEINLDNIHEYFFAESQSVLPHGQVMALRASYEGRGWLGILEKLLVMWKGSSREFQTALQLLSQVEKGSIKRHQVGWAEYKPQNQFMATQGRPEE